MAALEPYRFEPERVPDENHASDDENEVSERLTNLSWCTCGHCELRETVRESICCLEEPESENKFTEGILKRLHFLAFKCICTKASPFPDEDKF